MANERTNILKLGVFVLAGTLLLVLGLYLLGAKRDLFSRTLDVSAEFKEVSGLRAGSNVRYAGINVGTVVDITIVSDTLVMVEMMIRRKDAAHIRTDAVAEIASDGLMGNKLVNIIPGEGTGGPLADGNVLSTAPGLDTDAMLRTLGTSNENLVSITGDLRELAQRLNSEDGLLTLLTDTLLVVDVRNMVADVRGAAANAREITQRANDVVRNLQAGEGALGVLVSDPAAEQQVRQVIGNLQHVSDSLALVAQELSRFAEGLNKQGGLGHTLTRDTAVVSDVKRVIANLDTSSATLTEDLRALQRNWFFRKYFKEKEKERKP
ncbi:MAG: MCE family protein [Flavobacteriales bacterium]|nr:MCE family protein [Flavobacteriales bacterium]MBK7556403.1 MCE family protein [Flavobacteriales bacterium]